MSKNKILEKDLYRYIGEGCKSLKMKLRFFLFTPGFRYIYYFRRTQNASCLLTRFFWLFLMRRQMFRTGIQIPYKTKIGEGFRIVHFGAIVVNPDTIIGRNFNISEGCLIGNSSGRHKGTPIIGDNVCMNANSIIIGGVHIGNNVIIAPGAFVNFDVPDNAVVVGNPGKITIKDNPSAKYIVYPV